MTEALTCGQAQSFGELQIVMSERKVRVPHVACQARQHGLRGVPRTVGALQNGHGETVAQVMDAGWKPAAVDHTGVAANLPPVEPQGRRAVCPAAAVWLAAPQQRGGGFHRSPAVTASLQILLQFLAHRRTEGHQARLVELRLIDAKQMRFKVNVGQTQLERFPASQTAAIQQQDGKAHGMRTQRMLRCAHRPWLLKRSRQKPRHVLWREQAGSLRRLSFGEASRIGNEGGGRTAAQIQGELAHQCHPEVAGRGAHTALRRPTLAHGLGEHTPMVMVRGEKEIQTAQQSLLLAEVEALSTAQGDESPHGFCQKTTKPSGRRAAHRTRPLALA